MSYILDALKKAESERALGSVPDIHAQPVPLIALDDKSALWRQPLIWGALVMAVIALAALFWFAPWRSATTPAGIAAPAPSAARAPAPVVQTPVPAPAPPQSVATADVPAPKAAAPEPAAAEPVKPKAPPKPLAKAKEKPPLAAQPPAQANAAPAAEPGLPMLRDLPVNIQREIPAITMGGYIYASKPAERSVLINNRLLREGDQVAPGLMLEKMLPREAVLNYRGYRYRVPY